MPFRLPGRWPWIVLDVVIITLSISASLFFVSRTSTVNASWQHQLVSVCQRQNAVVGALAFIASQGRQATFVRNGNPVVVATVNRRLVTLIEQIAITPCDVTPR